jgi:sigma-B regulation protein RsbU (phosphoserine phosphatase)
MATLEVSFLNSQLQERKHRLEQAITLAPQHAGLAGLLREVDSALERMDRGTYGLCETCHEPVEGDRLLADPLVRYCLDHLTPPQRDALQRDLDLASQLQRNLLPQVGLQSGGWETSYHYEPVGPVSGDYCDLIPSDGHLFFVLGDVSGKGVAACMLMTQLHALFRSLTKMSLPLGQMVSQANRVFCESALAGQYVTVVCGQAKPTIMPDTCPRSWWEKAACCASNPPVCRWGCFLRSSSPPRACKWKLATQCFSIPTASRKPAMRKTNTAWSASPNSSASAA